MAGLGFWAILSLSAVNKNGEGLYHDRLIPLSLIAETAKFSENTRVQMLNSVIFKEDSTKIAQENMEHIDKLITDYKHKSMSEEESEEFNHFVENWNKFVSQVEKNISFIQNNQFDEALAGIQIAREPFSNASEHLKQLLEIHKNQANDLLLENQQKYEQSRLILMIVIVFAIILAVGIGLFIGKVITRPVMAISERARQIAEGDLTGDEILVKNKDEIGELASSFNQMMTNLKSVVSSVHYSAEELTAVSEEMAASSEEVASSANEVSRAMNHVAENTEKGNQSVIDVTSVLLELSSLIQIAKGKASSALENSNTTFHTANEGKEIVNESINKMELIYNRTVKTEELIQRLDQYSQEIGHITQMITSIADQTNLLALNASIEAARAGEHGKGFAVVASEVRNLAEQSNDGARQVAELVRKISGSTTEAVQAMQQNRLEVEQGVQIVASAGHALDRILRDVSTTLKEVDGISNVTDEEVASSDKIVALINELATVMENTAANTEEVAASTEETTTAMETVSSSAEEVSAMAQELRSAVEVFKI